MFGLNMKRQLEDKGDADAQHLTGPRAGVFVYYKRQLAVMVRNLRGEVMI